MAVIEANDLRRTYRTSTGTFRRRSLAVEAVRGVSFDVPEGELFGLLGPNGAGKTTTIKMLITLLLPTSGSARVLGVEVVKGARPDRGDRAGGDRGDRLPRRAEAARSRGQRRRDRDVRRAAGDDRLPRRRARRRLDRRRGARAGPGARRPGARRRGSDAGAARPAR